MLAPLLQTHNNVMHIGAKYLHSRSCDVMIYNKQMSPIKRHQAEYATVVILLPAISGTVYK